MDLRIDAIDRCSECERLSMDYETITMEWFRAQNQLRIVEFSGDDEASARIVDELSAIASRRRTLRDALAEHIERAHPRQASASSPVSS